MNISEPIVSLVVVGAGLRGSTYADYAEKFPKLVRIVGVADPNDFYRERMARTHTIPAEHIFGDWRELIRRPRLADGVIIATQDTLHVAPAVAFARKGYHILLEKPMAPTEAECRKIVLAAKKAEVIFAVCHVMRYTAYSRKMKELVDSGRIGDVVSIQHVEPVGYWHYAHSFVRGSWRNSDESSPMLLAKSCHDLDWISFMLNGAKCLRISSFGGLNHFRKEKKPLAAGAAIRCMECAYEPDCPYSAKRIYLGMVREGKSHFFAKITTDPTEEGMIKALREGPFGRCVYECDNNVVDHQVVNMEFEGNRTVSFTMTGFNAGGGRRTQIYGTRGEICGNGRTIESFTFLDNHRETIDTEIDDTTFMGGHGGGDFGMMASFVEALATRDPKKILSGPDTSFETHQMVFAAEKARHQGKVISLRADGAQARW